MRSGYVGLTSMGLIGPLAFTLFVMLGLVSPARAVISGEPFIWGSNGHLYGKYYPTTSDKTVLSQLKAMGMTCYRLDVAVDTTGAVQGSYAGLFQQYVTDAPRYGVKLLCMIYAPYNLSNSRQQNYTAGYNTTYNFCKKYPSVGLIEMGNELDALSTFCTGGPDDGASVGDYNAANCNLLAGCYSGMYAGAHAATPSVRCVIDCINHDHWGWFMTLQNDNVPWDITAVHWYTSSGSLLHTGGQNGLDKFSAFGKKIWITEVNNGGGSNGGGPSGYQSEINGMSSMVYDLYYYSNVEAIVVYSFYDDASGNYGLYADSTTPKPIVATMTAWIKSPTGPSPLPIGHRVALIASSGYYVTENPGNNAYLQADSATSAGTPQYFDVVESLWAGYGMSQVALYSENSGYYASVDWRLTGGLANTLICSWQKGAGKEESFLVANAGSGRCALQSIQNNFYVSCNAGQSDLLMAQYATTPGPSESLIVRDLGLAPYNPLNSNTYLGENGRLATGAVIYSPSTHAELAMQPGGNLVLINTSNQAVAWSSRTSGHSGAYLTMKSDGDLVLYAHSGSPLWYTGTYGNPGAYLGLTNSGNLAVYSQTGTVLWQTNTSF